MQNKNKKDENNYSFISIEEEIKELTNNPLTMGQLIIWLLIGVSMIIILKY